MAIARGRQLHRAHRHAHVGMVVAMHVNLVRRRQRLSGQLVGFGPFLDCAFDMILPPSAAEAIAAVLRRDGKV